ncbi:MAG: MerR family transcriptional regulator [Slackia sp.]|nr:MerR family transcriptional regulator [Slackia sp.]
MKTNRPDQCDGNDSTILSTGGLARFLGISSQGLHWYERQGIIKPAKTSNGYREYTSDDLCVLSRVRFYRQCGFSTETIEELLDSTPCNARELVQDRIRDIERTLAIEHAKLDQLKKNERLLEKAQHIPSVTLSVLEPFWLKKIYDTENGRLIPRRTSSKHWTQCLPMAHYYTARIPDGENGMHDLVGVGISEANLAYADNQMIEDIEHGEAIFVPRRKALYAVLAPKETPFLPAIFDEVRTLDPSIEEELDGSIYARPITCHRKSEGIQTYWEAWFPLKSPDEQ